MKAWGVGAPWNACRLGKNGGVQRTGAPDVMAEGV